MILTAHGKWIIVKPLNTDELKKLGICLYTTPAHTEIPEISMVIDAVHGSSGRLVITHKHVAHTININEEIFTIICESDILAIVNPDPNPNPATST